MSNNNPNLPPVGDSIDSLVAAARMIECFRNGTESQPEDPLCPDPILAPEQPESAFELLQWLAWVFYHLENPGHQG